MPRTSSSNTLFVNLVMQSQLCSGHCQSVHAWLLLAAFGFLQDQMVVLFFLQGFENREEVLSLTW